MFWRTFVLILVLKCQLNELITNIATFVVSVQINLAIMSISKVIHGRCWMNAYVYGLLV
jgi:hypothetical protein